jgi:hypothetical protein
MPHKEAPSTGTTWLRKSTKEYLVMALADPIEISIDSVDIPLARVDSGNRSGTYQSQDGAYQVVVSHTLGKRNRSVIRVTTKKIIPDPLINDINDEVSASITLVVDTPKVGFDAEALGNLAAGLSGMIFADTGLILGKFLSGES